MTMKIFICNDFTGFYPVGTAAVVVAENEASARELLTAKLIERGLKHGGGDFSLTELRNRETPIAIILRDGDY